jgi:hypothetical protein
VRVALWLVPLILGPPNEEPPWGLIGTLAGLGVRLRSAVL